MRVCTVGRKSIETYQVADAGRIADVSSICQGGILIILVAGCGDAAGDGFDEGIGFTDTCVLSLDRPSGGLPSVRKVMFTCTALGAVKVGGIRTLGIEVAVRGQTVGNTACRAY